MRVFSASLLLSLSFLVAQENDSSAVPCGKEPLDVHAIREKADAGDPRHNTLSELRGAWKAGDFSRFHGWSQRSSLETASIAGKKL